MAVRFDVVFVRKPFGGGVGRKQQKREWGVRADTRSEVLEFVNGIDPSAGSPTETLLRLLLPRNVQI